MAGKALQAILFSVMALAAGIAGVAHAADAALERAATAMGATGLKSLRYTGDGIAYTFGQAFKAGPALAADQAALLRARGEL